MQNLTKDDLKFLKELANEMKNQNNRCTASPYIYTVRDRERIYKVDFEGDGDCIANTEDYDTFYHDNQNDINEFKEVLSEIYEDEPEIDKIKNIITFQDCIDFLEINQERLEFYEHINYIDIWKQKYCFLTEKAVKKHIQSNHYHYTSDVHDYIEHNYKNPEFKRLINIVMKFAGEEDNGEC